MIELSDEQVDTQNENLKMKIPGFTQALMKYVMKIKEEENCHVIFLLKGIGLYQKNGCANFVNFGLLVLRTYNK